ncbi:MULTISPECIES: UTP--glucose-1-phosphate uridylyltransferase GalU [Neisseria]|uniref:UTP--glucose-1-phosphate uridylyltransferase n=1 Tax=Neisseria dumasiana TaxID=1931275 RepID=A0ABX3WQS1_9NEIS|nr:MULTISPECIES: UTP--glucose-1-phosphate uridylyltransferase GalU [Neisseria]KPN74848.1 UTP--glucose-1-phosphate uridylyltransferase [Neisseria sp. 74A18]OSI15631.1 UTP--glucose-1-phosphate uridylyltransferase [Neisseria dumasiana]OSI36658.1 UTP--glucose-1-phosphate uridylyltransferase [Neisseria dumasiana]UOO85262.1 UTP--glucose-1-phosphate uridylyltransferase GalU [Neisseria dumasiana]
MKPIKKAVFPVAGMGTRFLPATKASPKEMLPIVDKPLIQYAVEEAVAAGCTEMVFVTGRNKRSIEDHFDKAYELETELEQRNKEKLLTHVRDILPPEITCLYIRQAEALGLGHAVLCAKAAVGDNPFAVILADDLIDAPQGALKQMVDIYNQTGNSVLGVETVDPSQTGSYGIVEIENLKNYKRITNIVEKPKPEEAPSNLAVVGRYILTPRIFDLLTNLPRGAGNEIQLTDGIARLLDHEFVLAHNFEGTRYDCGSKIGYLEATLAYGLKHPETGDAFRELLKQYAEKA